MIARELITKLGFKMDDAGLKKAESAIGSLKNAVKGLAVAALAAMSFNAIKNSLLAAADSMESVAKAAIKTGLSVESIQKLNYAAHLADISAEGLGNSMKFLAKNVYEASTGSKEAQDSFKSLGIDPKKFKNQEDLFLAIGEKINSIGDVSKKTALAMKIFGRSGQELLPMFSQGSDAIREQMKQLERFNGVLGKDAIDAGNDFNDNLKITGTFFTSIRNQLAAKFFPVINKIIGRFIKWAEANKKLISSGVENFFKIFMSAAHTLWVVISTLAKGVSYLFGKMDDLLSWMVGKDNTFKVWAVAVGILVTALSPLTAAILVLWLLLDDFIGWTEDRPSALKKFWDVMFVASLIVFDFIGRWIEKIKVFFMETLPSAIKYFSEYWTEQWDFMISDLKTAYDWLLKIVKLLPGMEFALDKNSSGVVDDFMNKMSFGLQNKLRNLVSHPFTQSTFAQKAVGTTKGNAGVFAGNSTQNNNYNVNTKIEISTAATDAGDIADTINTAINNNWNQVLRSTHGATSARGVY